MRWTGHVARTGGGGGGEEIHTGFLWGNLRKKTT